MIEMEKLKQEEEEEERRDITEKTAHQISSDINSHMKNISKTLFT